MTSFDLSRFNVSGLRIILHTDHDGRGRSWYLCTHCGVIVRVGWRRRRCPECFMTGVLMRIVGGASKR